MPANDYTVRTDTVHWSPLYSIATALAKESRERQQEKTASTPSYHNYTKENKWQSKESKYKRQEDKQQEGQNETAHRVNKCYLSRLNINSETNKQQEVRKETADRLMKRLPKHKEQENKWQEAQKANSKE